MSYFGLHLQTPVNGWENELRRAAIVRKPYKIVKLFWVEGGQTTKNLSPFTTTVFRHNVEHKQPFLDQAGISALEADDAADRFILQFKDSINQHGHIDYVESLNETYATDDPVGQNKAVAFDRAFIRRLKVHCPAVKPVVYTAAPGNIDHDEWEVLVDLARECQAAGGAFGYHNYWSVVDKNSFVNSLTHAKDYQMRWAYSLDPYLVARQIRVKYLLGESGPIGAGPTGYGQRPNDGWKHPNVWAGDMAGYIDDLTEMDHMYKNSIPAREGRLIGCTLFTSGIGVGWDYFQIQGSALTKLTDYVMSTIPSVPPPDPDPVPPDLTFEPAAWHKTVEMQENGQNGIRLNSQAAIQKQVTEDNAADNLDLQIVTSETTVQGKTVQAVESLTGKVPRRVYVWEVGMPVYFFEDG